MTRGIWPCERNSTRFAQPIKNLKMAANVGGWNLALCHKSEELITLYTLLVRGCGSGGTIDRTVARGVNFNEFSQPTINLYINEMTDEILFATSSTSRCGLHLEMGSLFRYIRTSTSVVFVENRL